MILHGGMDTDRNYLLDRIYRIYMIKSDEVG